MSMTDQNQQDDIAAAPKVQTPVYRLDTIDALRGLVICLMVLDHVRDFIHRDAFLYDPLDLTRTSFALFGTRWITHLCAPTFVLLSGVSIYLQARKGKTGWALSRFLLTRGLWLIFLELTLVGAGFDFLWPSTYLQVIYAIGMSMVLMAALVWLPRPAVLAVGLAIVCGHNLFDGVGAETLGAWAPAWRLFMAPGPIPWGFCEYPALPWLGIMATGYGIGPLYLMEPQRRNRLMAIAAAAMLVLFVLLRLPNLYGNGSLWAEPANHAFRILAVFDVTKYPPSLDYVLVTQGLSFLLFLALQRVPQAWLGPLLAFGRTPLFTYLLHIYIAHAIATAIGVAMGVPFGHFIGTLSRPERLAADHFGLPLWGAYAEWAMVLLILYPLSSAYAKYRATHKTWWQSYL